MNLGDDIKSLKGVGPKKREAFQKRDIGTLEDLVSFFPKKYEDRRNVMPIAEIVPGKDAFKEPRKQARLFHFHHDVVPL